MHLDRKTSRRFLPLVAWWCQGSWTASAAPASLLQSSAGWGCCVHWFPAASSDVPVGEGTYSSLSYTDPMARKIREIKYLSYFYWTEIKTFADLSCEKDPNNLAFISEEISKESQVQQKSEISSLNDLNCYLH